jgi:predicted O-methyltransferase YrrM
MTLALRPTYSRSLDYVTGRDELPRVLNSRGLLGRGVEVGVNDGWFSDWILRGWRGERLYSVDPWRAEIDRNGDYENWSQAQIDAVHEDVVRRLHPHGGRSEILRTTSTDAASGFPDGSLDFVYIDAAHDVDSVREDIAAWYPKVRPGGIISGHDYHDGPLHGTVYGVKTAVRELCEREGLEASATLRDAPERTWFVRVPENGTGT